MREGYCSEQLLAANFYLQKSWLTELKTDGPRVFVGPHPHPTIRYALDLPEVPAGLVVHVPLAAAAFLLNKLALRGLDVANIEKL